MKPTKAHAGTEHEMPVFNITIKVEGDISKTEKQRLIRVMTKALRQDTRERNARLGKRASMGTTKRGKLGR